MRLYNSMHQYIDTIKTIAASHRGYSGDHVGGEHFYGTNSLQEAIDIFNNGYYEPLKDLTDFYKKCDNLVTPKKVQVNDYVGSRPNIGRYLRGLPKQMKRYKPQDTFTNNVTIFVDVCVSYAVTHSQKLDYGKKIISLINTYQKQGVNVELYACCIALKDCRKGIVQDSSAILIKTFNEPLNLLKLCFPLAHNAFFRRFHQLDYDNQGYKIAWGNNYAAHSGTVYGFDGKKYIKQQLQKECTYVNLSNIDELLDNSIGGENEN